MPEKPRCPQCGAVATAIYRREGAAAAFRRVPGWAYCTDHGPHPAKREY